MLKIGKIPKLISPGDTSRSFTIGGRVRGGALVIFIILWLYMLN